MDETNEKLKKKFVEEKEINENKKLKYLSFGKFLGKNIEAIYSSSLGLNARRIEENKEKDACMKYMMKELDIHLMNMPNTNHTSEVLNIDDFPEEKIVSFDDISDDEKKQYILRYLHFKKDAVIGSLPGKPISMQLADCNVIYIFDETKNAYGLVHSGWQGTLSLIIINTIEKMKKDFDINTKNLKFVLGPAISKDSFEVESDVFLEFKKMLEEQKMDPKKYILKKEDKENKRYIDLKRIIIDILKEKYDVNSENILNIDDDTFSKKNDIGEYIYHSHRRDGKNAGRNFAIIYLKRD